MIKLDVPEIVTRRVAQPLVTGLLGALLAGNAEAAVCGGADWDGKLPVPAPVLEPGMEWTYSAGKDGTPSTMRLEKVEGAHAIYLINGAMPYSENWTTYTDENTNRDGEKLTLHFPLKPGDSWTDKFSEPGEMKGTNEHYRYDYEESATSTVAGIEEITVAAGRFRTLRVDRVAHWVKDRPVALDGQKRDELKPGQAPQADGYRLTQLWYAPALGRAVLKATLRVGDAFYAVRAQGLLETANTAVVELTRYHREGVTCGGTEPLLARQPDQYVPLGYDLVFNSTWEWALRMREHIPMRSEPPADLRR